MRGSTAGSMPRARTSSPTWMTPARPRSRPPSTPARSGRAASGTPPRDPDLPCRLAVPTLTPMKYPTGPRPVLVSAHRNPARCAGRDRPLSGFAGLDDPPGGHVVLPVGGDGPPHDLDDLGGEQRIQGGLVDPERLVAADPDVGEACPFELAGERPPRQRL